MIMSSFHLLLVLIWFLSQKCVTASAVESLWTATSRLGASFKRNMVNRLLLNHSSDSYTESGTRMDEEDDTTTTETHLSHTVMDDDNLNMTPMNAEESTYIHPFRINRQSNLWDVVTSAFRMSLDAKDDLFSTLEQTVQSSPSLLHSTSSGGGTPWKSSTTAFIASRASATLQRVGKRIVDELTTEDPTDHGQVEPDDNNHSISSVSTRENDESDALIHSLDGNKNLIPDSGQELQKGLLYIEKEPGVQIKAKKDIQIHDSGENVTGTIDSHPRGMRAWRKRAARITGVHGFFSGKNRSGFDHNMESIELELDENDLNIIRRRIAAIQVARDRVADKVAIDEKRFFRKKRTMMEPTPASVGSFAQKWRSNFSIPGLQRLDPKNNTVNNIISNSDTTVLDNDILLNRYTSIVDDNQKLPSLSPEELEQADMLAKIDTMIAEGQRRILYLQCKKDLIQQHLNPLFNYTSSRLNLNSHVEDITYNNTTEIPRMFNFPSPHVVHEYIQELIDTHRLTKLNHTHLWRYETDEDYDDDIGDDLLTPSADAQRLYNDWSEPDDGFMNQLKNKDRRNANGSPMGGGSWLLRQSIGKSGSIGEKIGETVESAAYKGVCSAVMSFLARLIAQLHGVNVLMHSQVRLFMQSSPDLPPVSKKHMFDAENYAQETMRRVMRKSSKKRKMNQKYQRSFGEDHFVQRNAVVETLLSHCQISAPLLKLFPLAWQRAMLGNCVTLVLAIISDFCDNIQFPILGHILSLSLQPITEDDILRQIGTNKFFFNHRFSKPDEFEAAVRATANDISENLRFLDRWHERALGSDLLRAQLGNLIARIVLTLVDEILCGARIDLWTSQAGGPRLLLGLQYK